MENSECAPVPGTLEGLGKATDTLILGSLGLGRLSRGLDLDRSNTATRALAVGATRSKMLPLAEGAVAAIARSVPCALGVEAGEFIETDLVR